MTRLTQTHPLRDSIPCPLRAAIGIAAGLAISVGITRTLLALLAIWTPAEVLEDLSVVMLLLTAVTFVATLGIMGTIIQMSPRLRHFFCWCSDEPD